MRYTQNINLPIVEDNDLYSKEINNLAFEKIDEEIEWLNKVVKTLDNVDGSIIETKEELKDLDSQIKNVSIDVTTLGVKEGLIGDTDRNTEILQNVIDSYDNLVLFFPSGIFKVGKLNTGSDKNITFKGKSSSFATSVNKSVSNPRIIDTYSRIIVDLQDNESWIEHSNCTIIFDKISCINGSVDTTNTITTCKKNIMIKTLQNSLKGKVFATESSFIGWKCVSGDIDIVTKETDVLQSCWLANRCRFTENVVALGQLVDGRIIDCSFNKNDYAIIMKKSSGFTTIANNRIEWNRRNGIFIRGSHDITIVGNEFDRNGLAGMYLIDVVGGLVDNNTYRRNGAVDNLDREDFEDNVHFVIKNCENLTVNGTMTVAKNTLDTSGGGKTRPTNCSHIADNINCIFTNNNLRGCSKSDKISANKIYNNKSSIITGNIINNYSSNNTVFPEIHFMNGSADEDATLIKTSNGMNILVDCGEVSTGNWLCDRLIKLGVNKLDYLIVTHSHSDHIGGAVAVLERMKPDVLYYKDITWDLPSVEADWETLKYHNKMLNKADELGIKKVSLTQITTLNINDGEIIKILNCGSVSDKTDYNNDSLMILHEYLGTKTLIQSDCYSTVAYNKYKDQIGHVDLLKMCHHGGNDYTSKGWINELRPTYTFYTHEQIDNLEYYKALVLTKLYTRNHTIHHSGCFVITDSGVIPTSTVFENKLENRFINFENKWCYVNETGQLVENGFVTNKGKTYIIKNWYMVNVTRDYDWVYIGNDSYALMKDGSVVKNSWVRSNDTNKWYYCGDDGKYYKNTTKIIGMTSVSFDSNGLPTPSPS